ncbi:MAG: ATP-dependent DNA helicase [Cytophagales bacterium]|nr:ATP-dependent DNA helicase [Cytophagales bacterium]
MMKIPVDDFIKTFAEAVADCNIHQQAAIRSIDGPVMVLAGPGTGKTQILALRIANILIETDIAPQNILCLTYTDAGRIAMRERLIKFIGTAAYDVEIHTFHSFSNKVIQENNYYFANNYNTQPASDLDITEIIIEIIEKLTIDDPLKKYTGDIYSSMTSLKSLFSDIKTENYHPHTLLTQCDKYLAELPNFKAFHYAPNYHKKDEHGMRLGGRPNQNNILKETERIIKLKSAILKYNEYQELLKKYNRYDFNDMLRNVINAFENHEQLLSRYQQQYQYILADEFQDTNGAQSHLLYLLAKHWHDNPDLFVVGDDDQCIYSFQGAENTRMVAFVEQYLKHLKCIVLTQNYRSVQPILDAASAVIVHDTDDRLIHNKDLKELFKKHNFEINKTLAANVLKTHDEPTPTFIEYLNQWHETAHILEQIQEAKRQGTNLSTIAVIYHNHADAHALMTLCDMHQLPYNSRMKTDILEHNLIKKIILLLKYIDAETKLQKHDDILFELMFFEVFGIPTQEILLMARYAAEHKIQLREVMNNHILHLKIGLTCSGKIQKFINTSERLTSKKMNTTVEVLFEEMLQQTGIYAYALLPQYIAEWVPILTVFFDFIKSEAKRNPRYTVTKLLDTLDKMQTHGIMIPFEKILQTPHGLHFITAHSAKGLEFDTVYMIRCNAATWEDKQNRANSFNLFPIYHAHITDEILDTNKDNQKDNKIAENRRLFYVAMTRAKQKLNISWLQQKTGESTSKNTLQRSKYVTEALTTKAPVHTIAMPDDKVLAVAASQLTTYKPTVEQLNSLYIKNILKDYKLSVTNMSKYLKCPLKFYYEAIIKVPSAKNAGTAFGRAVHLTLEKYFVQMLKDKNNEFGNTASFIALFDQAMHQEHEGFNEKEYYRYSEYGHLILPEYLAARRENWNKNVYTEYRIHQTEYHGVPITGVIDKIELLSNNTVNVVDYKTGKSDHDHLKKKFQRPKPDASIDSDHQDIHGGDYYRQLVFYKILIDEDKKLNRKMVHGEMDFIEKNKDGNIVKHGMEITKEDIDIVTAQILETYKNIMEMNFYTGCGKEDCTWCNFVKDNGIDISLNTSNVPLDDVHEE